MDVYAADISQLAFPGYGDIAQKEEKFRRFLAGLDPTLRAKCHEQGATDLEEALIIAVRCEMARETLKLDYVNIQPRHASPDGSATAMVHSILDEGGAYKAIERLTEDMREMRLEMRRMTEENKRLRVNNWRDEWRTLSPGCQCMCGEQGCPSRRPQFEPRGRSPDRRWPEQRAEQGNNSWQHVFHVLRGSTQTALLGLDFLVPNRALLDYAHGAPQLWDTVVPLLCGNDFIPECCNVSITTATTLPPLSASAGLSDTDRAHGPVS